jgi:hypothetical protein
LSEEELTRNEEGEKPAGDTPLEKATERVNRALVAMKKVTETVALKQATAEMSLEQSAAAVVDAANQLSKTVTLLSKVLSDISFEKSGDDAALRKAMKIFTRAAGELSKVSGNLNSAVSARKGAARSSGPSRGASSDQIPRDRGLAGSARRLKQTASSLSDATETLSETMADLDTDVSFDSSHPMPPDEIALKED